jgi:hypothetical protein
VGLGSLGKFAIRHWRRQADPQTTWVPRPVPLSENGIGFVSHGVVWRAQDQRTPPAKTGSGTGGLGSFRKFAIRDCRVKKSFVWVKASYPSSRLHHGVVAAWRNCFVINKNYVVNGERHCTRRRPRGRPRRTWRATRTTAPSRTRRPTWHELEGAQLAAR